MHPKERCKANQPDCSCYFTLGLLILDDSEGACPPQAVSAAKKTFVHFLSGKQAKYMCVGSLDYIVTTIS